MSDQSYIERVEARNKQLENQLDVMIWVWTRPKLPVSALPLWTCLWERLKFQQGTLKNMSMTSLMEIRGDTHANIFNWVSLLEQYKLIRREPNGVLGQFHLHLNDPQEVESDGSHE